jgi:hypothetical protein
MKWTTLSQISDKTLWQLNYQELKMRNVGDVNQLHINQWVDNSESSLTNFPSHLSLSQSEIRTGRKKHKSKSQARHWLGKSTIQHITVAASFDSVCRTQNGKEKKMSRCEKGPNRTDKMKPDDFPSSHWPNLSKIAHRRMWESLDKRSSKLWHWFSIIWRSPQLLPKILAFRRPLFVTFRSFIHDSQNYKSDFTRSLNSNHSALLRDRKGKTWYMVLEIRNRRAFLSLQRTIWRSMNNQKRVIVRNVTVIDQEFGLSSDEIHLPSIVSLWAPQSGHAFEKWKRNSWKRWGICDGS